MQCETCHTWQHLPCYGFTGLDDPRLYDRHTCYHCLLAGDKTDPLEALQRLVQKRRVMHFIIQHGTRSQTEFIDDINMPVEVAGPIYQMLKSAGYFVPATGSHKAGYKKTGKPLFVAVRDGPNYEKMLTTLFDPLMLIAHYVSSSHRLMPTLRPVLTMPSIRSIRRPQLIRWRSSSTCSQPNLVTCHHQQLRHRSFANRRQ